MYLLKIDYVVKGSIDDPDNPAELATDYINLDNLVSINPMIEPDDNYTLFVQTTSNYTKTYIVHPSTYDNVLQWLDKAVVCDGGAV